MERPNLRRRSSSRERYAWCHGPLNEEFTANCNGCGSKLHIECSSKGCTMIGCSNHQETITPPPTPDKGGWIELRTPDGDSDGLEVRQVKSPTHEDADCEEKPSQKKSILKSRPIMMTFQIGVAALCVPVILNMISRDEVDIFSCIFFIVAIFFNIKYAIKHWRGEFRSNYSPAD